jgi:ABC-type proline/glycine betaine transport system substrate-binding protein
MVGSFRSPAGLPAGALWHVLEEPPFTVACARALEFAADGRTRVPADGCAYERAPLDALAHVTLRDRVPDVVAMLERMETDEDAVAEALAWARDRGLRDDWEPAAVFYLERQDAAWRSWVAPEAARRVEEALANLRGGAAR